MTSRRRWALTDRLLAAGGGLSRAWPRRIGALILAAVLTLGAFVPPLYRASTTLAPPATSGQPTPVFGQFGGNAALMSSQPVEIDLAIAQGYDVATRAAGRLGDPSLTDGVEVAALRGGMLRLTAEAGDPATALARVAAYRAALQECLIQIARQHGPAGPLVTLVSPHAEPGPRPRLGWMAAAALVLLLGLAAEAYAAAPPPRGSY